MTENTYEEYPGQPAPLEWAVPPETPATRAEEVMSRLRDNPLRWARIDSNVSFHLSYWYDPIRRDPLFEVKTVPLQVGAAFPSRDVYARYLGHPDTRNG